jgi:hypothetical protein
MTITAMAMARVVTGCLRSAEERALAQPYAATSRLGCSSARGSSAGPDRPGHDRLRGRRGARRQLRAVDDIATKELVTASSDQDVDEARRLMAEHELDRILVTENDQLVGIISEADIRRDEGPLA